MDDLTAEVMDLLCRRSLKVSATPTFELSSGAVSRYYVDVKRVSLLPRGQYLIGKLVFERIRPFDVQGIGGLTLGADPIALAVSLISGMEGKPIPAFIVRKEAKSHGTGNWIEGDLPKGARVVVVDDVVTTAGSTLMAVKRLTAEGHTVIRIIALVDREEGGREAILKATGMTLDALFTLREISARWEALQRERDAPGGR